ncbi:Translation initiation factor 2, partial [hydrothermal vent metagenome]
MASTSRPPIIAVMGHIDHGKSSLLDYIRKSNVVEGEAGGITQHVSAYEAEHEYEGAPRRITFLDTPGHEAFHALRARGASVADVAILVVASDEGVKPQTLDALTAINDANIPYVVALTKIDKRDADIEHAKATLLENEVYLEGLGGSVPYTPISSKTGDGIPELLDLVLLTADLAEISADPEKPASGFVLESMQDPKRGLSATLIVKDGTLKTGTFVVAGEVSAPVRFMEDFLGKRIKEATPSMPVLVTGFSMLPPAGTPFVTASSRKEMMTLIAENTKSHTVANVIAKSNTDTAILPLIIKADVTGSIEAIQHELTKVTHERAEIRILGTSVGVVSENDVKQARASDAVIIAFDTPVDTSARDVADRIGVSIESFTVIYDLEKRVEELLIAHAPRITKEETVGEAKILKTFNSTTKKHVAGARLVSGVVSIGSDAKVMRRNVEIGRGKI